MEAWYKSPLASPFHHRLFHPQTKSMCSGSRPRSWKQSPLASLLLRSAPILNPELNTSPQKENIRFPRSHPEVLGRSGFVCTFLHPIHRSQRSLRWDPLNFVSVGMEIERMAQLFAVAQEEFGWWKKQEIILNRARPCTRVTGGSLFSWFPPPSLRSEFYHSWRLFGK